MPNRLRQWIGFFIMLAGLIFLSSPFLVGAYHEMNQKNVVAQFHRQEPAASQPVSVETESTQPAPETELPSETAEMHEPETVPAEEENRTASTEERPRETEYIPETQTEQAKAPVPAETEPAAPPAERGPIPHRDFYDAAAAYNAELVAGEQEKMQYRVDLENFALDARHYGFSENIVGTIRIPRLDVELGLYLGAGYSNMAKGTALFGLTSIPLGQPSENAAIAGHRGWRGTAVFRDIQKIQMNDPIYITTPWAELEYRVCAIEIVTPNNINWCKIQPGRTLVTLMTCHPYGQNYQRYIVYAELAPKEVPAEQSILQEILDSSGELSRIVTLVHPDGMREKAVAELAGEDGAVEIIYADGTREKAALDLPEADNALSEKTWTIVFGDGTREKAIVEPEKAESIGIDNMPVEEPPVETPDVTPVTVVHADGTRETAFVDASAIDPDGSEYGAVVSNVVIMAENRMKPIACVMAVLVAMVGIWLTAATIRDRRKQRGGESHGEK